MSIGVSQFVRHMPFEGSSDPSLPDGMWHVAVESIGDASGGDNTLDVGFATAGSSEDFFYSLEQFGDQHDTVVETPRIFQIANQRNPVAPTVPITSTVMGAVVAPPLPVTGWKGTDMGWLPYWCGQTHRDLPAVQLFLRFRVANTNTVAYRLFAWGYRWSARSIATPTGPRRPPGSVFGS